MCELEGMISEGRYRHSTVGNPALEVGQAVRRGNFQVEGGNAHAARFDGWSKVHIHVRASDRVLAEGVPACMAGVAEQWLREAPEGQAEAGKILQDQAEAV